MLCTRDYLLDELELEGKRLLSNQRGGCIGSGTSVVQIVVVVVVLVVEAVAALVA